MPPIDDIQPTAPPPDSAVQAPAAPAPSEAKEEATVDDTMAAVFDKMEEGEQAPADKPTGEAAKPDEAKLEGEEPSIEAPTTWSDEEKTEFGELPRALQAKIVDREKQRDNLLTTRTQELTEARKGFEQLDQLMAPHRDGLRANNLNDIQGVERLVRAHEFLNTNPIEAIRWIAKEYGADLGQLTGDPAPTDPEVHRVQTQIMQMRSEMGRQEHQRQQAAWAAHVDGLSQNVGALMEATGEDGSQKYPHFDKVADDLIHEIGVVRSQDPNKPVPAVLDEAYSRAVWSNPEVRKGLIEAQAKEQAAEHAAKADRAKAVSLHASDGVRQAPAKGKTWEDTMSAAYDRAQAG